MSKAKQDAAIEKAILAHEHWKSQWTDRQAAFSRVMISPRGKTYTYTGYCLEVRKHMEFTIKKIRKVIADEMELSK